MPALSLLGMLQGRDEKKHAAGDASPDSVFAIKVSEISPNLQSSDRDAGGHDVPYRMQQRGEESGDTKSGSNSPFSKRRWSFWNGGAQNEPRKGEADQGGTSPERLRRRWVATRKEMQGATELVQAKLDLVEPHFDKIAAIFDIVAGESGLLTAPLVRDTC